ncbi:hypothetical protein ANCCAN_24043 [Ancylostoma caninum]|uniref:Histone deacetylase domain-containing protein n=1 Tax=Ancylostoma caninum TaxID=29170 RepID=A0A368FDE2_ANCCA|nr:hypothetical protein ANCCAN_24043 [Ancylostoma caninum]
MFPLNGALNTEGDYISAFHHVLLPMLRCFKPEAYLSSYRPGSILATTIYRERKAKASKPMGLFGHMVRMLNEICPNRVIAVLEGGYYVTNYTEAASMMVRGLQGLPLPQLCIGKLSPAFKETIWNNLVHHAPRYPLLHQWLRKLQANQVTLKHGLLEYKPRPTLYLGKGMRELWEETKRTHAVRTREWFPELTRDEKKLCDEAIAAYVKTYNYTAPTEDPSEQFLMQQMTWTERSGVEAFAHSAPICLHFVHEFTDFLEGKRQSVMICDRELMPVNCFSISCASLFHNAPC